MQYARVPWRLAIAVVNVLAIGAALVRRDRLDRLILWLFAVHGVGFALLFANKTARYLTVLMPFMAILVAKLLRDLWALPAGVRRPL